MTKRAREVDALMHLQDDKCYLCAKLLGDDDAVDVDHKVRLADGGADEFANKCAICVPCHRSKTRRENSMAMPTLTHDVNEYIRGKQSNRPLQVHQRYSIHQLRGWWNDGAMRNADCNRVPVWDLHKRRAFLSCLLEGGITPPVFVNTLRSRGGERQIYDGANRLTTIMEFMDGASHVVYECGRRRIAATYGRCRVMGCKMNCTPLDDVNRRMFESIMIDVFEWDELSTQDACITARHLNEGTPMSIGEKLKLLLGFTTHRARVLKHLAEMAEFRSLVAAPDRERELKILALFFRHIVLPDASFSSALTANFAPIENFFTADAPVDSRDIQRAEEILSKTAEMLEGRSKTQRNLLLCLIGLPQPHVDVRGALTDADAESTVEDVLERWTIAAGGAAA